MSWKKTQKNKELDWNNTLLIDTNEEVEPDINRSIDSKKLPNILGKNLILL